MKTITIPLVKTTLQFRSVTIWWNAPEGFSPIGLDHARLNGRQVFRTQVAIHYQIGDIHKTIPENFCCDGASIPRFFWRIPGFSPLGWHFWATLIHDYACEHPREIPRSIGDAIFYEVLRALKPNKTIVSFFLFAGVRSMTYWLMLEGKLYKQPRGVRIRQVGTRNTNWPRIILWICVISLILGSLTLLASLAHGQPPLGSVYATINLDPSQNTSPGFINHLAIYVGDNSVIESQADRGVLLTPLPEFLSRPYRVWLYLPRNPVVGARAAAIARTHVGLPYGRFASLGPQRIRGLVPAILGLPRHTNCVAEVRRDYEEATGLAFWGWQIPDDIYWRGDLFSGPYTPPN